MTLTLSMALVSSVSAQETVVAKSDKANDAQAKNPTAAATDDVIQTADTTATQEKGKKDKSGNGKGQMNAESHRSMVADFVRSLLAVADREGGIGQQVKVIAQQQNNSKEKVAGSIDKVEKRNKVKTFFFGSDYKNLGELRSEMVKTRSLINRLKRLAEKAENGQNKMELQNQIQALEQEQASIDNFIAQNEGKFSLFGWAVKLFSR